MSKKAALIAECDVAFAMSMLGGKWKIVILWKLFEGTRRFGRLRRSLPGISEGVLTHQLRELEADGLVHRESFPTVPPRVEYSLTARGRSLETALTMVDQWGADHRPASDPLPLTGTAMS